ncbi:porin [Paraburkholderia sp. DGU8]|uniref:porin n=1 Tax=Paraburkholderia sp. DGU8 TaxID=3161997 RepID=UPI00346528DC
MKKHLCAQSAALAFLLVGTTLAHAQGSVTLYGIIDQGLNYVSNSGGGKVFSTTSGVIQGSNWGVRGVEDLGAGLRAGARRHHLDEHGVQGSRRHEFGT